MTGIIISLTKLVAILLLSIMAMALIFTIVIGILYFISLFIPKE